MVEHIGFAVVFAAVFIVQFLVFEAVVYRRIREAYPDNVLKRRGFMIYLTLGNAVLAFLLGAVYVLLLLDDVVMQVVG